MNKVVNTSDATLLQAIRLVEKGSLTLEAFFIILYMMRDWDKGRSGDKDCVPVSASAGEVFDQPLPKKQKASVAEMIPSVSFTVLCSS